MKLKIAFLASYPQSLLNFRLALMQEFLKRGYDVVAIAPFDQEVIDSLAAHQIQYIPISMERNGLNPFSDLTLLMKIRQILKKEKPDILFSYTIKPIIYGSTAAKLARVPTVYSMITGTGYVFLDADLKSKIVGFIARLFFRLSLRFNTLVFFQNEDNLNFFRQKKILSSSHPADVINGSGVDCEAYMPADFPKDISFLMIARFLYDKGIREFIEAAKIIKKKYPHIKFQLVGWIDTNPYAISQQELDEWIKGGVIEYLGKLSDVRPAIANSSVYVLPSYHEGTPRTVLEAMAMARPIITTDVPGCRGTVVPEQNGLIVQVKNAIELAKAMEFFILSPEKIQEMGKESRKQVIEKYDVHKVNHSILQAMKIE